MSDSSDLIMTYIPINVDDIKINLAIVSTHKLKVHERAIPELLNEIKSSIINNMVLYDPIVADNKLRFVVDGTHRLIALNEIGIDIIPTIDINYFNDEIRVKRWFRILDDVDDRLVSELKLKGERINIKRFINYLDQGIASIGVYSPEKAYFVREKLSAYQISDILDKLSINCKIFIPEEMATNYEDRVVIGYRPLSKQEIINDVNRGVIYTSKFTRHIIPFRLLKLNVPLKLLSKDQIDELKRFILNKKFRYLGRGVEIESRFYEEDVVVGV